MQSRVSRLLLWAASMVVVVFVVFTLIYGAIFAQGALFPQHDKPFEVTGVFVGKSSSQFGVNIIPWNNDTFVPSEVHTGFGVDIGDPSTVLYRYMAFGAWKGPLPAYGSKVKISSPTGLVKDVVIRDLATGQAYTYQP